MSDLFLSYAREDREMVRLLADALSARGWSVFWDVTIPTGRTWRQVIDAGLREARCVVVVWSHHSVNSRWVVDEADDALHRNILIPVRVQNVEPPLGFRSLQAADLTDWTGDPAATAFTALADDISALIGAPSDPQPTAPNAGESSHTLVPTQDWRSRVRWPIAINAIVLTVMLFAGFAWWAWSGQSSVIGESRNSANSGDRPPTPVSTETVPVDAQPRVHFINVGQGTATLVELNDAAFLVDAGGDTDGSRRLLTYLDAFFTRRRDLHNRLSAVLVSHSHIDHVAALREVLMRFQPSTLIDNGGTAGSSGGAILNAARTLYSSADRRYLGLDGAAVGSGKTIDVGSKTGHVRAFGGHRGCTNENNNSLVVRVDIDDGGSLLLPADADVDDQTCTALIAYLLEGGVARTDVLQVPHHGSTAGLDPTFLRRVSPKIAVISAGRVDIAPTTRFDAYNYGHPRAATVDAIASAVIDSRPARRVFVMSAPARTQADQTPVLMSVDKAVFCTCWDGDVVVPLTRPGGSTVHTSN